MSDIPFKLSTDETMRRLQTIAQSPGELEWRLNLLDTLGRMRVQSEVTSKGLFQRLSQIQKAQISRTDLAEIINAQIKEKTAGDKKELHRVVKVLLWLAEKFATIAIGVACTLLGLKELHG